MRALLIVLFVSGCQCGGSWTHGRTFVREGRFPDGGGETLATTELFEVPVTCVAAPADGGSAKVLVTARQGSRPMSDFTGTFPGQASALCEYRSGTLTACDAGPSLTLTVRSLGADAGLEAAWSLGSGEAGVASLIVCP